MKNKTMKSILPLACCSCRALVSCGGGGGGGSGNSASGFAVASVNPPSGASGVSRTLTPGVAFNGPLSSASVSSSDVQLLSPQGISIPITTGVSNQSLALKVDAMGLPGNSTYKIVLLSPLSNTQGQMLPSSFASSFTTTPQKWNGDSALYPSNQATSFFNGHTEDLDIPSPLQAVDPSGNVTVAWIDDGPSGSGSSFDVARFSQSSNSWGVLTTLQQNPVNASTGQGTLSPASLVTASNGDVYAVWLEQVTSNLVPHVARYQASTGMWTTLAALPNSLNYPSRVQLAADDAGNVTFFAALYNPAPPVGSVVALRYSAASASWSAPVMLGSSTSAINVLESVQDGQGNQRVFWSDSANLSEATYNAGSQTSTAAVVLASAGPSSLSLGNSQLNLIDAKFSSDQTLVVSYSDYEATRSTSSLYLRTLASSSSTWADAVTVYAGTNPLYFSTLTADQAQNLVVTYNTTQTAFMVVDYNTGSSSLGAVSSVPGYVGYNQLQPPQIGVDVAGNLTLVWENSSTINESHYRQDTKSWSSAPLQINNGGAMSPAVIIDAQGNPTANWYAIDANTGNTATLDASRFQ
jgi:hypothetical protein